ncbi:imidazole glycerol phosphate synthase subunit HisH [Pararcticibacter amylolyticus]|uniref:Imidazole glycerol phosphate synthase subunit HisH n=1 Tax=Pararcticibacter amylolyticus TaxID=2173175 RepID=A0A2U2PIE0_9SPHI|nr:imidazole glycerol phosphate synthase subunit HisH [Pararcticibacter amylolyticus]PWG81034.1 imidazole glycerol phosphate synthase subunit HisH [Pararcticibacter amylolyticus]
MIGIVNYGLGNVGSIQNMLKKIGYSSIVAEYPELLKDATKIILPGVGAFNEGMRNLTEKGWISVLNKLANEDKLPILGICLGMQLMTSYSEEGNCDGLNWIEAKTRRLNLPSDLKVPHMGWNTVIPKKASTLFDLTECELRYYHVHSYYVELKDEFSYQTACTYYGSTFTSAFQKDNIMGVQFHPEKSHRFGMDLLKNFCERC